MKMRTRIRLLVVLWTTAGVLCGALLALGTVTQGRIDGNRADLQQLETQVSMMDFDLTMLMLRMEDAADIEGEQADNYRAMASMELSMMDDSLARLDFTLNGRVYEGRTQVVNSISQSLDNAEAELPDGNLVLAMRQLLIAERAINHAYLHEERASEHLAAAEVEVEHLEQLREEDEEN